LKVAQLEQSVQSASDQIEALQSSLSTLTDENSQLKGRAMEAEREQHTLRAKMEHLTTERDRANDKADELDDRSRSLRGELARVQDSLAATTGSSAATAAQVKEMESELALLRKEADKLRQKNAELETNIESKEQELTDLRDDATSSTTILDSNDHELSDLRTAKKRLAENVARLEKNRAAREQQLTDKLREVDGKRQAAEHRVFKLKSLVSSEQLDQLGIDAPQDDSTHTVDIPDDASADQLRELLLKMQSDLAAVRQELSSLKSEHDEEVTALEARIVELIVSDGKGTTATATDTDTDADATTTHQAEIQQLRDELEAKDNMYSSVTVELQQLRNDNHAHVQQLKSEMEDMTRSYEARITELQGGDTVENDDNSAPSNRRASIQERLRQLEQSVDNVSKQQSEEISHQQEQLQQDIGNASRVPVLPPMPSESETGNETEDEPPRRMSRVQQMASNLAMMPNFVPGGAPRPIKTRERASSSVPTTTAEEDSKVQTGSPTDSNQAPRRATIGGGRRRPSKMVFNPNKGVSAASSISSTNSITLTAE
jgi:chromosome segregation ATPase